jgi:hypothetical protein
MIITLPVITGRKPILSARTEPARFLEVRGDVSGEHFGVPQEHCHVGGIGLCTYSDSFSLRTRADSVLTPDRSCAPERLLAAKLELLQL